MKQAERSKMTMSILGKLRDSGPPPIMKWDTTRDENGNEIKLGPDGKPLAAKPKRPKDEFDEGGAEGPEGY